MNDSIKNILLIETEYWKIELMPNQCQLGRSIVILKRPCPDLSSLNNEEIIKFLMLVKKFEHSVLVSFNATYFNWYVAMNGAFKNKPYDPQLHWHVKPRLEKVSVMHEEGMSIPGDVIRQEIIVRPDERA